MKTRAGGLHGDGWHLETKITSHVALGGGEANICGAGLAFPKRAWEPMVWSEGDIHWCPIIIACARPSEIWKQEIRNLNITPSIVMLSHSPVQYLRFSKHRDPCTYFEPQKKSCNKYQVIICCINTKGVCLDIHSFVAQIIWSVHYITWQLLNEDLGTMMKKTQPQRHFRIKKR